VTAVSLWIECASESDNPGGFATRLLREGRAFLHGLLAEAYAKGVRRAVLHRPNGESLDGGEWTLTKQAEYMLRVQLANPDRPFPDPRDPSRSLKEGLR